MSAGAQADTAGTTPRGIEVDPPDDEQPEVQRLGRAAKAWRLVVLAVLTGLFLAGTLVGDDPWWPFSPWRMFSTSSPPNGSVVYMSIEIRRVGDTADSWRPAPLALGTVGLSRAEVEGRIGEIIRDPAMLGTLAASHHTLRPGEPDWTAVRLVRNEAVLHDRKPTGVVRHIVLAGWAHP